MDPSNGIDRKKESSNEIPAITFKTAMENLDVKDRSLLNSFSPKFSIEILRILIIIILVAVTLIVSFVHINKAIYGKAYGGPACIANQPTNTIPSQNKGNDSC